MKLRSVLPLFLMSLAGANAAVSVTGSVQLISGETDVSTEGTLVLAHSYTGLIGGSLPPNPVVNGVTFTSISSTAGATGAALTGYANSNGTVYNSSTAATTAAPDGGAYDALIQGAFSNSGGTATTLSLSNLLTNQSHLAQIWIHDARAMAVNRQTTFSGVDEVLGTVTLGTVDYNSTNLVNGTGQFINVYFTTGAAETTFTISGVANDSNARQINAFQLRAIPEPQSALLGAIGILSLLRRRR